MKSKAYLILLALFFIFSLTLKPEEGLGQSKRGYSLEETIAEALANNKALKAKKEKITQAAYIKRQARAAFLPKFGMTYGYTRLNEVKTLKSDYLKVEDIEGLGLPESISIPPGPYTLRDLRIALRPEDNYQWKGTITQPVFTGFALSSAFKLAELGIDQSRINLELEKLNLVLKAKEAYFGILKADRVLNVVAMAVESLESHVNVARRFHNVGMIPINDLLKAEVELANARHNLVKAKNASRLARFVFNVVLSRPINDPVDVQDIPVYKPEKGDFKEYLKEAFNNRPEMKLVEINIRQADQMIRLARSRSYPEVGLEYNYIKEGDDPSVSGSTYHEDDSWEIVAGFSWTFWEWGKTHYSIKEKKSLKEELIQLTMVLKDTIRLEVKGAVLGLEEANENIPSTKKAVEQAKENLRVSKQQYKVHTTTSTEVLDAQTLLTQATTNYYSAVYDHELAKAKLLRAIGTY